MTDEEGPVPTTIFCCDSNSNSAGTMAPLRGNSDTDLAQVLRQLFPEGVHVAVFDNEREPAPLFPEEEECVRSAVPSRRLEFAKGRECAHRALEMLGVSGIPIPAGRDRAPRWPDGVVGSVTHSDSMAAAVVAHAESLRGIGLDTEPAEALPEDAVEAVLTDREARWALGAGTSFPVGWPAVLFSAKEAVYKCVYPILREMFDFKDIELELDPLKQRFTVRCARVHDFPELSLIDGGFALAGRYLVTGAVLKWPAG